MAASIFWLAIWESVHVSFLVEINISFNCELKKMQVFYGVNSNATYVRAVILLPLLFAYFGIITMIQSRLHLTCGLPFVLCVTCVKQMGIPGILINTISLQH